MADKNNANIGFEKEIWDAACVLWGHIPAAEYRKVIIGLIFLRYISAAFDKRYKELVEDGDGFEVDECTLIPSISAISLCDFSSNTYKLKTVRHPSGNSATNAINCCSERRLPLSAILASSGMSGNCSSFTTSWVMRFCFRR